jgi:hypothetical protein
MIYLIGIYLLTCAILPPLKYASLTRGNVADFSHIGK